MRVCIPGRHGVGGPASFQRKLTLGLEKRGILVTYDLRDRPYDVVLVIAGTRHLGELLCCKRQGVPIVQRLDGINWRHQVEPMPLRQRLLTSASNWIMRFIRDYLADHIVYQSQFVRGWWHRVYGKAPVDYTIIYNGVDLDVFNPQGPAYQSQASVCFISVEGNLDVDRVSLQIPISVLQHLVQQGVTAELLLFGGLGDGALDRVAKHSWIKYSGTIANEQLPYYERGASVFISSEVNPPCPNSVVEALACGTPVMGFDTGSLAELLAGRGGRVAPYGGDPWRLEPPDMDALAAAAEEVLADLPRWRYQARRLAEERYTLEGMTEAYLELLFP